MGSRIAKSVLGCQKGSDTYDNRLSHEAADLLVVNYPGQHLDKNFLRIRKLQLSPNC